MGGDEIIWKINLIEILKDEIEATGRTVEEPEDLASRSEEAIHQYFKQLRCTDERPSAAGYPEPTDKDFSSWFPGLTLSKTSCDHPRWRVLCFPNAGNAEDMYTSEGTGSRRTVSPLLVSSENHMSENLPFLNITGVKICQEHVREELPFLTPDHREWCRENSAECLAVQLPGRNLRRNEEPLTSCQEVAEQLLPNVASRLATTPYLVIAHSVGCWNAFEFLTLARKVKLPVPKKVFLSAMADPSIPKEQRPWREQHLLGEDEFKVECKGWDVNELVFSPSLWGTYQSLMRADFTLFDQYTFQHADEDPFAFPLTTFWGTRDRRISEEMVQGWRRFTTGPFRCHRVEGHHLWPLDAPSKTKWLQMIVDEIPA